MAALCMPPWITTDSALPREKQVVETMVMDDYSKPPRNVQKLFRQGRLWFVPDGSIYVYYTPTHWK